MFCNKTVVQRLYRSLSFEAYCLTLFTIFILLRKYLVPVKFKRSFDAPKNTQQPYRHIILAKLVVSLIVHFTVLWHVTRPLHESEVRVDLDMIETKN